MSEFKKRPVKVDAVRWTGSSESLDEIYKLCPENLDRAFHYTGKVLFVRTLEGSMQANIGDWIIKGVAGEVYPCKPDIFKQTYTPSGRDKCKKYCKFGNMDCRPCDTHEVCCFEWRDDDIISQNDNAGENNE